MSRSHKSDKSYIWGLLTGLILGSAITFIVYNFNIPVIETIKYIRIPYLTNSDKAKDSIKNAGIQKEHNNKSVKDRDNVLRKQREFISETEDNVNRLPSNSDDAVDTLKLNNAKSLQTGEDEDIVVVKDQIIATKTFALKTDVSDDEKSRDAKLSKVLTDDNEIKQQNNLLIEFWKSPLNYQGYKMSADKLIIYGIEDTDTPKFFVFENSIFMNYEDKFYRFDNTEKFRSLNKITNAALIEQLKISEQK